MLVPLLGVWILVAAVVAVLLGRSVRSAELGERPVVPVVPGDPAEPTPDEEPGYVQICLFDATALRA